MSFKPLIVVGFLLSGCAPIFDASLQENYTFFHTQIKPLESSRENKTFVQITYLNNAYPNRFNDGEYFIVGFNQNSERYLNDRINFYNKNCTLKFKDRTLQPQKSVTNNDYGALPNYNSWTLFYLYKLPTIDQNEFSLEFTFLGQGTVTLSFSKSL